jgi:hypothetical protein
MEIEKIVAILIELLEQQEGVKIDYKIEKKEPEEKTA